MVLSTKPTRGHSYEAVMYRHSDRGASNRIALSFLLQRWLGQVKYMLIVKLLVDCLLWVHDISTHAAGMIPPGPWSHSQQTLLGIVKCVAISNIRRV